MPDRFLPAASFDCFARSEVVGTFPLAFPPVFPAVLFFPGVFAWEDVRSLYCLLLIRNCLLEGSVPSRDGQQGGPYHGQSPGHLCFPVIQVALLGLEVFLGPLVNQVDLVGHMGGGLQHEVTLCFDRVRK